MLGYSAWVYQIFLEKKLGPSHNALYLMQQQELQVQIMRKSIREVSDGTLEGGGVRWGKGERGNFEKKLKILGTFMCKSYLKLA